MKEKEAAYYLGILDLWKLLCESHNQLHQFTIQEYQALLASDVDLLETVTESKISLLQHIYEIEKTRREVIKDMSNDFNLDNLNSTFDLIRFFYDFEQREGLQSLEKYNQLLIDIIEKLQEQNRVNQKFLNKAIGSLERLRRDFSGTQNYSTYNSRGMEKR